MSSGGQDELQKWVLVNYRGDLSMTDLSMTKWMRALHKRSEISTIAIVDGQELLIFDLFIEETCSI